MTMAIMQIQYYDCSGARIGIESESKKNCLPVFKASGIESKNLKFLFSPKNLQRPWEC